MNRTTTQAFFLAVAAWAQAADRSDAEQRGIHFADQSVSEATSEVGSDPAKPSGTDSPEEGEFGDISLFSTSPVVYNGLGLIIRNRNHRPLHVAVHDSRGRAVLVRQYPRSVSVVHIETDRLIPGAYIYTVKIGDRILSRPFIVAR
jgi:hypothetical protein